MKGIHKTVGMSPMHDLGIQRSKRTCIQNNCPLPAVTFNQYLKVSRSYIWKSLDLRTTFAFLSFAFIKFARILRLCLSVHHPLQAELDYINERLIKEKVACL